MSYCCQRWYMSSGNEHDAGCSTMLSQGQSDMLQRMYPAAQPEGREAELLRNRIARAQGALTAIRDELHADGGVAPVTEARIQAVINILRGAA